MHLQLITLQGVSIDTDIYELMAPDRKSVV